MSKSTIVILFGLTLIGGLMPLPPRADAKTEEPVPHLAPEAELEVIPVTPAPVLVDIKELERVASKVANIASGLVKSAPVKSDPVEEIARQADDIAPSWVKAVYPVRLVGTWGGQQVIAGASAVAVGPGKLHTVSHLSHQVANYRAEVQVDGKWLPASWSPAAGKDLAVLTIAGVELNHVLVRAPEYGERVTVYGLATKSFAQGRYVGDLNPAVGDGVVPLEPGQTVTEPRDSGGGVFGDDGALLGTLTGRHEHVHQVAAMVPIVSGSTTPPVSSALSAPKVQSAPPAVQSCPGGVCPAPSSNQPSQQFAPRRGIFGRNR